MNDPRLGVLCCGHLRVEVSEALRRLGAADAEIACFPTSCHLPKPGEPHPAACLAGLSQRTDAAVALCMNCAHVPVERGTHDDRLSVVHVGTLAELLLGADACARALSEGAFVVLPGWAARWREVICETWGFDRDTARVFFAETSRRILALDTIVRPLDRDALSAFSDFVGLPVEVRVTGISHLEALLGRELDRRRQALTLREHTALVGRSRSLAAEHAAIVDFVTSMGDLLSEAEILGHTTELLTVLFGPRGGVRHVPPAHPSDGEDPASGAAEAGEDGRSIHITLAFAGADLGRLEVRELANPPAIPRYLPLAHAVGEAAAMALHAARTFRRERRLREQLAVKVDELDSFVSISAHDMRQPLTTAMGYSDLLSEIPDSTAEQRAVWQDRLRASLTQMHTLLEDLLTLSRVGRAESSPERVDLRAMLERLRGELAELLAERSVELRVAGTLPAVRAAPRWIHETFQNLITNSIKYNDAPIPTIEIGHLPPQRGTESQPMAAVFVRDNGIGIDPEETARAFDMFRRLSNAEGRPGTGVGLSIVRKAVEGEGGRVWIESAPGQGTTVYFTLPLASEPAGADPDDVDQAGAEPQRPRSRELEHHA